MSAHIGISESLVAYLLAHTRESEAATALRLVTASLPRANMLTTPDQAHFLAMLVKLTGARQVLEIGTFTGYSALAMAEALPEGGTLIACDVSHSYTDIGRPYWRKAGVEQRIDLRIAPALQTLETLKTTHVGAFDMVFIDADKANYDAYYEASLALLRVGGVVVFDNMLWDGEVANPANQEPITLALRALNAKIHADDRVEASLLTLADGMVLAQKR